MELRLDTMEANVAVAVHSLLTKKVQIMFSNVRG